MPQQCIFCPRLADSQEHIWSEWILKLLPKVKKAGTFTRKLQDGTMKTWAAKYPVLTAGVVCAEACNNGWMSTRLERPMKETVADIILKNTSKDFSPEDCATITAWAFKTTILANHIDPSQNPFFSVDQRYAFARDLTIPSGVSVWLARRDAGYVKAEYHSEYRLLQPPMPIAPHLIEMPISPYRFEQYVCTLTIGYLLLQVIAARWTERKVSERLNFPPIRQGEFFEDKAIPIWPRPTQPVSWPPSGVIGNELFTTYRDRFAKFTIPNWMIG